VDERVRQLEPVKVSVDGRDILVEPAERRVYESALASFRASDFPAAQSGFQTLIARYPKTGYLPSALFWLGNAQYATRDYKEAITNFRILLQAAPDHLRAPEALLSIANCQIELKDTRGARKSLEDLGKAYPQSEAAQAGKERLARLR
jgi:tol-pal system protein YbgF